MCVDMDMYDRVATGESGFTFDGERSWVLAEWRTEGVSEYSPPTLRQNGIEVCRYISYRVKVCTLSQSTKIGFAQDGYRRLALEWYGTNL